MKKRLFVLSLALMLLALAGCSVKQWDAISSAVITYGSSSVSSSGDGSLYTPPPLCAADQDMPGAAEGNLPDSSQEDSDQSGNQAAGKSQDQGNRLDEDGWYSSKEEVALYIHLYDRLPDNYVSKKEAQDAGWHGGNVERYTGEGTAIGGSSFGNREGLLPKAEGRTFTECDIGTVGGSSRGAERIVFSNDGLVYYTGDHYESFELLYGEP